MHVPPPCLLLPASHVEDRGFRDWQLRPVNMSLEGIENIVGSNARCPSKERDTLSVATHDVDIKNVPCVHIISGVLQPQSKKWLQHKAAI